jgi:glutaredoxin-like protein
MIPLDHQEYLREVLGESLVDPVKIDFYTQKRLTMFVPGREECEYCEQAQELLEDLCRLHPALRLTVHQFGADPAADRRNGIDRVPATVMRGVLNRPVTIYGYPIAYLFTALVQATMHLSQNRSALEPAVVKKLKRLREPVAVRMFVAPTSEYCGRMLITAFQFAVETKLVKVEAIEAQEFPRLVQYYGIQLVPFTIVNERAAFPGEVDPQTFAEQIVKASTSRTLSSPPVPLGATPLQTDTREESADVRPSGLIIPGR